MHITKENTYKNTLCCSFLSGMECELTAHRQRSREELAEMEKLLNVARREHSKATVDIQQLTRQLTRDKERAIEAAGMCREGLEQELATCRKKLQAMQVERNLLMVSASYGLVFSTRVLSSCHSVSGDWTHTQKM